MMFHVLVFLLVNAFLAIASRPALPQPNGPSCARLRPSFMPCLGFLKGEGEPKPSFACCEGVARLPKFGTTRRDRIFLCGCLKDEFGNISGIASRLPTLPRKCDVQTTLPPIDKNYDCNKVTMFHISDSNDQPRQDGLIHVDIKASYIHKSTVSENYKDSQDVPMDVEKNRMENYKHIQDVPMTQERDRMASKGCSL